MKKTCEMMTTHIPERLCELLLLFYDQFPSGGFLHVVTDDGNWEHKNFGQEETVVDWVAIQFPKLLEVFKKVGAL